VRDACSKQAKAKGEEGESRGGEEGTEPKPLVSPEPSDPWEVEPPARRPAVPAIEGRAEWATADPPTTFGPDDRPGEPPSGPDPEAVAACVRYIEDRFVTVNPGQVKRALASGAPPDLIRLAAWITKHQRGRAGVGLLFTILRDDLMPVYQTDGLAGIPWPRPGDGPASDPPPIPATLAEQERASRLEAERARAAAAEAARRILATREEASRPALQAWYRGFAAEHPELKEKLDRRGPAAPFAPAARRAPRPRPVPHLLDPPAEDPATVAARRRELAARLAAAGVPADRLSTG
jgi:hypothetical protein